MSKKKAYHHGDLRTALVQATLQLVSQRGPRGFSMTEACRQAGVSATAVYRHFANKEAILAEVARQGFDQLTVDLKNILDSIPIDAYRRRLVETGLAYVAFAHTHPAHFQVMFGSGLDKEGHPDCQESGETALQILLDEVARAVAGGAMPQARASVAMTTLWATVHGLAMLDLDGIKSKKQEMLEFDVPACLEALVQGFCPN
ncbi:hypothetical protein ABS71_22940 [bacterium SCN 62-11]|nr:MAG: hypothetical protein ABS71_22940 [bacterium SCN 62-11]